MPYPIFIRYPELVARGIVNSRPQLSNLIIRQGFPPGRLLSPNVRAWTEDEIADWLASRPVAPDLEKYIALGKASAAARGGKSFRRSPLRPPMRRRHDANRA